jgi:DNA-binding MarR family transcriptional regulator
VAAWAKRCYLAGRAAMESMLRPFGLGATQWYVLHRLAQAPAKQSDVARALQVERATLSVIVTALVRKGLVEQLPDRVDQRQKLLRLTAEGARLWEELPDLHGLRTVAFDGLSPDDLATAIRFLQTASARLEDLAKTEGQL